jgi:hypothetical protein
MESGQYSKTSASCDEDSDSIESEYEGDDMSSLCEGGAAAEFERANPDHLAKRPHKQIKVSDTESNTGYDEEQEAFLDSINIHRRSTGQDRGGQTARGVGVLFGEDSDSNEESSMVAPVASDIMQAACHVAHLDQDYKRIMGGEAHFDVRAPIFPQGMQDDAGWLDFETCREAQNGGFPINPKRAMCINIPAECFSSDATRITHWQTPLKNPTRATNIATLLGLLWTPTSKGWM